MSLWQLWLVGAIYLYTGLKVGISDGDWSWSLVWCGYAAAQVGLIFNMPKG